MLLISDWGKPIDKTPTCAEQPNSASKGERPIPKQKVSLRVSNRLIIKILF